MRKGLLFGERTAPRVGAVALGSALSLLFSAAAQAGPFDATPADNDEIEIALGALLGSHIGSVLSGIILQGPVGAGAEAAAFATDQALKLTPPVLVPPGPYARLPNAAATGGNPAFQCVYRFDTRLQPESGNAPGTADYSRMFGIGIQDARSGWGDLGSPFVFHSHADVGVRVLDDRLAPLRAWPEFTEGQHALTWQATTMLNVPIDSLLPPILMAATAYAEGQAAKRLSAESAKRAGYIIKAMSLAADAGLAVADGNDAYSAQKWYEDTSVETARNSASQLLTVWDVHPPYVRATNGPSTPIGEQTVQIEATDFGGARFQRVQDSLRQLFAPTDDCGKAFNVATSTDPFALLPLGTTPTDVAWTINEVVNGPYQANAFSLPSYQTQNGSNITTTFTQHVRVVDTQGPILVAPPGFARYSSAPIDLSAGQFPLGIPRVVDLADPTPRVTNDAPAVLEPGRRYDIHWQATDASNNPAQVSALGHTQTVTIKLPGTNTAPTAAATAAQTVTSRPVDIVLTGSDGDVIDGRPDPLEFRIDRYPEHGAFEAPIFPFFIEDFRLTPAGARDDADNLTRTSPLGYLAEAFFNTAPADHASFLQVRICNALTGDRSYTTFGRKVPQNFVYQPTFVHVDDDGFFYILDERWACVGIPGLGFAVAQKRLSKWRPDGTFVKQAILEPGAATLPFQRTDLTPLPTFEVDRGGRIWLTLTNPEPGNSIPRPYSNNYYSVDSNLSDLQFHGSVFVALSQSNLRVTSVGPVVGDTRSGLLYQLYFPDLATSQAVVRIFDVANPSTSIVGSSSVLASVAVPELGFLDGRDLDVDNDGNIYVLGESTVHKITPFTKDAAGVWHPGAYVGWLGGCSGNLSNANGVPYNNCDTASQTSRGFSCTYTTCVPMRGGARPGHFAGMRTLAIDPNDVIYVADTGNSRVQRFSQTGVFSGMAVSTGTGINQGDQPGFVLGNMGTPVVLSVNSTSLHVLETDTANGDYFVHVFKTLPFFEVTESSAKVRYTSDSDFHDAADSFTYVTSDGIDLSAPAQVDVAVARAQRPPEGLAVKCFAPGTTAPAIPCALDEDATIHFEVSGQDPDGFVSAGGLDRLSFSLVEPVPHGTISLLSSTDNAARYAFAPAANWHGTQRVTMTASDGVLSAAEPVEVDFLVRALPDPARVVFATGIRGARGFPSVITADYSDPDDDFVSNPTLTQLQFGDGVRALAPIWDQSGIADLNGRSVSPQIAIDHARGKIVATHVYQSTGQYTLQTLMTNTPVTGFSLDATSTGSIEIVEATVVSVRRASPQGSVAPDADFPLGIVVTNEQPAGWAGLPAGNVGVSFAVPNGLALSTSDGRCSVGATVSCSLGDLAAGASTTLAFTARIPLALARESRGIDLAVSVVDAGPKAAQAAPALVSVTVADADGDGTIDVDDAFPSDRRYAEDADGDGLADEWELAFGLDPTRADDTTSDADGDGRSLLDEFLTGGAPFLLDYLVERPGGIVKPPPPASVPASGLFDNFGFAITGADFDRDGYADTVVGAPNRETQGAAFLIRGGPDGPVSTMTTIPAAAALTRFGESLVTGDWDGNGYPDLAIAGSLGVAIYWNNGQIYPTADRILPILETSTSMRLVSGDLDNDGRDDLVAMVRHAQLDNEFRLYLSGDSGWFDQPRTFRVTDVSLGDSAVIADIDGDGLNDFVVGGAFTGLGVVRGFLGADNDWDTASAPTQSFELQPRSDLTRFGSALASGQDFGSDGIDDLVVGAYGGAGAVVAYNSLTSYWQQAAPQAAQVILGAPAGGGTDTFGDQLGVAVAMGLLDRDGTADVVAGANRAGPLDEGRVRVYHGNQSGIVLAQDLANPTPYDMLGYSVAIPGDIDGDGVADIALGAPVISSAPVASRDGGAVHFLLHGYESPDPANDDGDADRVGNALDNCPTLANTDQRDMDRDQVGDVCDSDADGDNVPNTLDNCPLIAQAEQADFDADGLGDVCDTDDDNDGAFDEEDRFPRDARYSRDTDGDGMADAFETANGLDPLDAADGAADPDGDGRTNAQEFAADGDINRDDVPPGIAAADPLVVTAIGPLTPVALTPPSATDFHDGPVAAATTTPGPFRPGRHLLEWRASDNSGNEGVSYQQLDVIPLAGFSAAGQDAAEGQVVEVTVELNGDPVSYPVVLPFTLGGTADAADHAPLAGEIVIGAGRTASLSFELVADGVAEGDETLVLTLASPVNAALSVATEHRIRIVEGNLAPAVSIEVTQAGEPRTRVYASAGLVTLAAVVEDPNPGDTHTFSWSASDAALVPAEGFAAATFTFDPAALPEGPYEIALVVADSGSPPLEANAVRRLAVAPTPPTLSADEDSDGDGVDDAAEGLTDSDEDGVADYLDNTSQGRWLAARGGGREVLQTVGGAALRLGSVALAAGDGALVSFAAIAQWGANGGAAGNAEDQSFNYPSGLFDFEIVGLAQPGASARVVLPLEVALPERALYRKYVAASGWRAFVEDAANSLASAPGAAGACPEPGSVAYTPGLTAGDQCVELVIEDGGPNDADGVANGIVRDPGGVAVRAAGLSVMTARLTLPDRATRAGTNDVVVVRVRVNANSSDLDLRDLTLRAVGSGDERTIRAVKLWRDVDGDGAVDAGSAPLGQGTFGADDGTLRLQLSAPLALPMGDTDLLVTYDF